MVQANAEALAHLSTGPMTTTTTTLQRRHRNGDGGGAPILFYDWTFRQTYLVTHIDPTVVMVAILGGRLQTTSKSPATSATKTAKRKEEAMGTSTATEKAERSTQEVLRVFMKIADRLRLTTVLALLQKE